MADTIIQLTANDFEEAMDFLNLVFGAYRPHDFAKLLPVIYRPTDTHMANNYTIRHDGRIRAIVGMFPITWHVGNVTLRVAGIGGVSTHPNRRGTGLMRKLMEHCVHLMKEQGYHLSWLGGQRQRYLYFGYEKCGNTVVLTVNTSNVKHCFDGEPGIRFEPITPEDGERIAKAKSLHDAQPMHCRRPIEDFYLSCVSWHHQPFAALDNDNRMVGYLVANGRSDTVTELLADNDDVALRMVHGWVAHHTEHDVTIEVPPVNGTMIHNLAQFSEQISARISGNWQVFDWSTVTDALMKMRRLRGPMLEGSVVVGIAGYGAVRLEVAGGEARCVMTDEQPDVHGDASSVMRLLFGPLAPSFVMPLPAEAALLESWCPLPLNWARQDGV
jgi:predicted N-acetyltransferase YhbS